MNDLPAVYLPRVGNAFSASLNGGRFYAVGHPGTRRHDTVKRPYLIALPAALLRRDDNVLQITVEATGGRAAQLGPVTLGVHDELEDRFELERFWRVQLSAAMMWMALTLGLMSLAVWRVQREPMFLSYAVAELAWAARLADMFFIEMPLPWPQGGAGVAVAFAISQLAIGQWRALWIGWIALATLCYVLLAVYVGWRAFRERHYWRWIFACFVLMATVAGALDVLESPGSIYMHPTWSRLVWAGYSLALAALVARRLLLARHAQQQANETLRLALAAQAAELDQVNRLRSRVELDLAMAQERQRVMRDMHDVLGARLSGLLSRPGVRATLRT